MLPDNAEMAPRLRRREELAGDGLSHGDERIGKTCFAVARMKQQFRRAPVRAEYAVAGSYAIADQKTVEVLAHGGGQDFVLFRLAGAFGAAENFSVAANLLLEKRDGPTAHHPVMLSRIDGLKGIVPVSVSVADQMGVSDEAL